MILKVINIIDLTRGYTVEWMMTCDVTRRSASTNQKTHA